jgi:hypothetical protein
MTEFLIGKREIHAYGKEAVGYGTEAASINRFVGLNARFTGIKDDADFQEILSAGSANLNVEAFEQGNKIFGGVLQFVPQEWRLLEYIFGSVSNGGSPGAYTHTFVNEVTLPSFTFERAKQHTTDRVHKYLGCKAVSLILDWNSEGGGAGGKFLNASIAFVTQDRTRGTTSSSITPPTTAGFKARMVKLTLNGNEISEVKSGSVTIANALHDSTYANSTLDTKIGEPTPEMRRVTGRITVLDKDDTFQTLFDTVAEITGTNTLELIRGSNDKLVLTFTGLVLKSVPSETNLGGINTCDLIFSARSVSAVCTDAIQTY